MRRIVLFFLLSGMLTLSCSAKQKLQVVTSIKPVQTLLLAIAGDLVDSHQLIPDYASPHDYAFKPSDLRRIHAADLIFRIDEHFESLLNPALNSLDDPSKLISLAEYPNIHLLAAMAGHHHHADHDEHAEDKDREHEAMDLHIFTSPDNARVMAQTISQILSQHDPEHAQVYQQNLQLFQAALQQTVETIKTQLAPLRGQPFIVFHPSWQYFARYFQLQTPQVVNVREGLSAGVKTVRRVRQQIASQNIRCVFYGQKISDARLATLTENLSQGGQAIKTVELDAMAWRIRLSPANSTKAYLDWLATMGQQVQQCLEK